MFIGVQVVYGKPTKRITLQRAICSKVAHFSKEVTFRDLLVLVDNLLWCQDKASSDPDFANKFGLSLKVLTKILKAEPIQEKNFERSVERLSTRFLQNLDAFLIPKRNTRNVLRSQDKYVEVRRGKPLGTSNKLLPPERYIGLGYRDKGTAKNPAADGSPSWQEVAMHRGDLYEE